MEVLRQGATVFGDRDRLKIFLKIHASWSARALITFTVYTVRACCLPGIYGP